MKIIYPYNEILPLKRAHDAYIVRNCASLADQGHEVTLLIGSGSMNKKELFKFYKIDPKNKLNVVHLPILRRKNLLRLQWNFLFFWCCQKYIEKHNPDCVILSVLKQAHFHVQRRLKECLYVYEVHQLQWYPTMEGHMSLDRIRFERAIYNRCNLITVTTHALGQILKLYPYQVTTQIEKVPLACDFSPLGHKESKEGLFHLYYVGQLYAAQGLSFLLRAVREVSGIHLHVVGGKPKEIRAYQEECNEFGLSGRVTFEGFYSSKDLHTVLENADGFITTFDSSERMPYVAHTKLYEYQAWQRPIIAPNLNVVQEQLSKGAILYEPENIESLIGALERIQEKESYGELLEEAESSQPLNWEKRGCLFNKYLNKLNEFYESK